MPKAPSLPHPCSQPLDMPLNMNTNTHTGINTIICVRLGNSYVPQYIQNASSRILQDIFFNYPMVGKTNKGWYTKAREKRDTFSETEDSTYLAHCSKVWSSLPLRDIIAGLWASGECELPIVSPAGRESMSMMITTQRVT